MWTWSQQLEPISLHWSAIACGSLCTLAIASSRGLQPQHSLSRVLLCASRAFLQAGMDTQGTCQPVYQVRACLVQVFRDWHDQRQRDRRKAEDEKEASRRKKGQLTGREIFMEASSYNSSCCLMCRLPHMTNAAGL